MITDEKDGGKWALYEVSQAVINRRLVGGLCVKCVTCDWNLNF
jgi:hypothetical protein